jgi:hypothetical protein
MCRTDRRFVAVSDGIDNFAYRLNHQIRLLEHDVMATARRDDLPCTRLQRDEIILPFTPCAFGRERTTSGMGRSGFFSCKRRRWAKAGLNGIVS